MARLRPGYGGQAGNCAAAGRRGRTISPRRIRIAASARSFEQLRHEIDAKSRNTLVAFPTESVSCRPRIHGNAERTTRSGG